MFIESMLLATAPSPFSHSDYIFEPKVDGHRLIFSQESGVIRLYTRHNNDCSRQYPELQLPFENDIILDGEIACVDPGWLAAVLDGSGKLRLTGIIEHGPGPKEKKAFYGVSRGIVSGEDKSYVYLEPLICAEVKMRNWTKSGLLRSLVSRSL